MKGAGQKAVIPKEWEITIKTTFNSNDDRAAMYEFIIDYQTETPPPDVDSLPVHLRFGAAIYIPQLQRMNAAYKEKVERINKVRPTKKD